MTEECKEEDIQITPLPPEKTGTTSIGVLWGYPFKISMGEALAIHAIRLEVEYSDGTKEYTYVFNTEEEIGNNVYLKNTSNKREEITINIYIDDKGQTGHYWFEYLESSGSEWKKSGFKHNFPYVSPPPIESD